jgi:hypothetical protein
MSTFMQYDPEHPQMDYGQSVQSTVFTQPPPVDIEALSLQLQFLEQQGAFENKTTTTTTAPFTAPYSPTRPNFDQPCPPSPVWDDDNEDYESQASKDVLEVIHAAYEAQKRAELVLSQYINDKNLDVQFRKLFLKHVKGVAQTKDQGYRQYKDLKLACENLTQ